jgi:hypothetical protein
MKTLCSPLLILLGSFAAAHGAIVQAFWSAQTEMDAVANGGVFNPNVTASTFPTTVSIAMSGPEIVSPGGLPGGSASFQDFQGNNWNGTVGANGSGFAFGWNGTGASGAGTNRLTINFDLTNLQNLSIQMQARSATGGSAQRATAFSAIEYSLDGGSNFTSIAGLNLGNFTSNNYVNMSFDLSALDVIEGQSNVQIRFSVGATPSTTSFRMDNIQVMADTIPEPSLCTTLVMGAGLVLLRRKRG